MLNSNLYPAGFRAELTHSWRSGNRGEAGVARLRALTIREAATKAGDPETAALASQQIAWFCFQLGDVEQGLGHTEYARQVWQQRENIAGQAWTGAMHAWLLLEAGLMDEAAQDAVSALALAETGVDPLTLAFVTTTTGTVFWYCKQLERALEHCARAVEIARPLGEASSLSCFLVNLAGVHSEIAYRARRADDSAAGREAIETALAINQEAIDLAEEHGDSWCLRLSLCNAAEYLTADNPAAAMEHLERCEQLPGMPGQRAEAHFLYTKAQVLIRLRQFHDAFPVCQQALALAEATRNTESTAYALRYMSEIHEGLGQFEQALASFRRFHDANALLADEKIQRQARIAEIRYEAGKFRLLADSEQRRAEHHERTSLLDPLTGIANRRRFDAMLSILEDKQSGYAIAMIDLDHFKAVNDRFSHLVGDEVLRQVGAILAGICGVDDLAVRMGGEEFALLIDGADLDDARKICLSLQHRLAAVAWSKFGQGLSVTISIGVGTSTEAAGARAVLALADARLYRAKVTGRDRVVSWTPAEAPALAVS